MTTDTPLIEPAGGEQAGWSDVTVAYVAGLEERLTASEARCRALRDVLQGFVDSVGDSYATILVRNKARAALAATAQAAPATDGPVCVWTEEQDHGYGHGFNTACGRLMSLMHKHGDPCPYCGKRISVKASDNKGAT